MSDNSKAPIANQSPVIRWDDSNMNTNYANVTNVSSTREEVTLLFGTNQSWDSGAGMQDVTIKLSNRLVLSPYAAKRMNTLLSSVIEQYEERFGVLDN
jgi:hypothetical protein